ncbi:MAG: hypothetical protein MK098_13775 [Marinovum sp.]|nr:hypothetical protein [Marinovum sp.]
MNIGPYRLFQTIERFSGCLRELEDAGIHVELGDDFQKYRRLRLRQTERSGVYPMFDAQRSFVDHTNGFWVCGYGPDGDLVHTQAVRLMDMSDITLADHLALHRHKYITPDSTPDPDNTSFVGPRALATITGKVAYHGDFWLRSKGLAGPRGNGATAVLSRMLIEIAALAWNPSYIFALVPKALAVKGLHLRYCYSHCQAGHWIGPDKQVTDEDHLIWMSADDIAGLMADAPPSLKVRSREIAAGRVKTTGQPAQIVKSLAQT